MRQREETILEYGWSVTRHSPNDPEARWVSVAKVPTVIHLDLMALGRDHPDRIADPFKDLNELDARWVADVRWSYTCHFTSPDYILKKGNDDQSLYTQSGTTNRARRTNLVFKGLDTLATVTLNGVHILNANNMFVEYTVDVTNILHGNTVEKNKLLIVFESARLAGLLRVDRDTRHEYHVHQTEIGRAAIRKAQYQWGWDWGPVLNTAGPWQPVLLDSFDCCIEKVSVWTRLDAELKKGTGSVKVTIRGNVTKARLCLEITSPSGEIDRQQTQLIDIGLVRSECTVNLDFQITSPELWWPHGYGQQKMYTAYLVLLPAVEDEAVPYYGRAHQRHSSLASDKFLDKAERTFAFRRSRLIQQTDRYGTSFYIQINGIDIFAGGSNWIPADSFLRKRNYERLLDLVVDSNQIMVRIWGGGIYEYDYFYNMCDKRGILVWQDFAFACASYPAYDAKFLESVAVEARQNVARLQRHPSLVIWAGNNEDYQMKEHYDLKYDPSSQDRAAWLKSKFPARYIYEEVLPSIVSEEYGVHEGYEAVPYQPGCPYGDPRSTTLKVDPSIGDIHQWNVWHGAMKHYQEYAKMGGRFVSEFGMQAYPHPDTLARNISTDHESGKGSQCWPGSITMDVRNKAIGHQFRLLKYVAENFRIRELDNPITFGHLTQIVQADAVSCAYRGWRRMWEDRRCGGALIWQLNDCWPTVSWSVVDYYGVPKPALFAIKRAMAPLAINVERIFHDWTTRKADDDWQRDTAHVEPNLSQAVEFDIWVASSLLKEEYCTVIVRFVSIETGLDLIPKGVFGHTATPNTTSTVAEGHSEVISEDRDGIQRPSKRAVEEDPAAESPDDANRDEEYHVKGHPLGKGLSSTDYVTTPQSPPLPNPRRNPIVIKHSGDRYEYAASTVAPVGIDEAKAGDKGAGKDAATSTAGWSTQLLRYLSPCVIHVALYDSVDNLVSTDTSWPDPIKYLEFQDRGVVVSFNEQLADVLTGTVSVTAKRPVKGFVFTEKEGGIRFSDNGFDVIPGEEHVVFVERQSSGEPWPPLEYTYVGKDIWG